MVDKLLAKSLKKKQPVRLLTSHPDGQSFIGVVIRLTKGMIVIREIKDFEVDGVVAFPRRVISSVIEGPFHNSKEGLMRHHRDVLTSKRDRWLKNLKNIQELVEYSRKLGEWVVLEKICDDDSVVYVGSVQSISGKSFQVTKFPKIEKQNKRCKVKFSDIFRIEMFSRYISSIQDFANLL